MLSRLGLLLLSVSLASLMASARLLAQENKIMQPGRPSRASVTTVRSCQASSIAAERTMDALR
jgi:hypothetical protein